MQLQFTTKKIVVLFIKHSGVWRTLKLTRGTCAFPTEEMNSYPSPELQEECENLDQEDTQQQASMNERLELLVKLLECVSLSIRFLPLG